MWPFTRKHRHEWTRVASLGYGDRGGKEDSVCRKDDCWARMTVEVIYPEKTKVYEKPNLRWWDRRLSRDRR